MSTTGRLRFFAMESTVDFGTEGAHGVAIKLSLPEERTFEDGKYGERPRDVVSGNDM